MKEKEFRTLVRSSFGTQGKQGRAAWIRFDVHGEE